MSARKVRAIDRLSAWEPDADREVLLSHIICGDVTFDGELIRDAKATVSADSCIAYKSSGFVSRGGLKLDHALAAWSVNVAERIFVDAGASTGGFTHALLVRGAKLVHAVDVGYNQLDYRLRRDSRVVVHERTNIMDVHELTPQPHMAVADLSFRSVSGAARHLLKLTSEGRGIVLVKPQFEWRESPSGFDGRVPDQQSDQIVAEVQERLAREGVVSGRVLESPIRGRAGNREFLVMVELRS